MRIKPLKSRIGIDNLFKKGTKIASKHFVLFFISAAEDDCTYLMVSAPKKVFPRAVDRNRVKRRMREMALTAKLRSGTYAIIARNAVISAKFEDLCAELSALVEKVVQN